MKVETVIIFLACVTLGINTVQRGGKESILRIAVCKHPLSSTEVNVVSTISHYIEVTTNLYRCMTTRSILYIIAWYLDRLLPCVHIQAGGYMPDFVVSAWRPFCVLLPHLSNRKGSVFWWLYNYVATHLTSLSHYLVRNNNILYCTTKYKFL